MKRMCMRSLWSGIGSAENRCLGSAEASAAYLFPKDGYDLTVDTHSMTSADGTEQIYAHCFFMNA